MLLRISGGGNFIRAVVLLLILPFISSCFKKDDPILLEPPGEVKVTQIGLGSDYKNQVYFQFNSLDTVGSDYRIWDLAFDASADGYHIWINGGNQALASFAGTLFFESIKGINANWNWDAPSWNPDSTAIGDWTKYGNNTPQPKDVPAASKNMRSEVTDAKGIFVIDRGASFPTSERFWKIIFQAVDKNAYTMKYGNLKGTEIFTRTITKNYANNYIFFSFADNGKIVNPEPAKLNWDILFTRYRYIFYNPPAPYIGPLPYLVEGILINPYKISVAKDSTKSFSEIDYSYAKNLPFGSTRDIIGYDWKSVDLNASPPRYTAKPYINYILKDQRGYYWKFHFIDYYNNQNEKGYPKFEFQRL